MLTRPVLPATLPLLTQNTSDGSSKGLRVYHVALPPSSGYNKGVSQGTVRVAVGILDGEKERQVQPEG